jgi:hypothetical protein
VRPDAYAETQPEVNHGMPEFHELCHFSARKRRFVMSYGLKIQKTLKVALEREKKVVSKNAKCEKDGHCS